MSLIGSRSGASPQSPRMPSTAIDSSITIFMVPSGGRDQLDTPELDTPAQTPGPHGVAPVGPHPRRGQGADRWDTPGPGPVTSGSCTFSTGLTRRRLSAGVKVLARPSGPSVLGSRTGTEPARIPVRRSPPVRRVTEARCLAPLVIFDDLGFGARKHLAPRPPLSRGARGRGLTVRPGASRGEVGARGRGRGET